VKKKKKKEARAWKSVAGGEEKKDPLLLPRSGPKTKTKLKEKKRKEACQLLADHARREREKRTHLEDTRWWSTPNPQDLSSDEEKKKGVFGVDAQPVKPRLRKRKKKACRGWRMVRKGKRAKGVRRRRLGTRRGEKFRSKGKEGTGPMAPI